MPSRRWRYNVEAEAELEAAAEWYEKKRPGLGGELIGAVEEKILEILEGPQRWRVVAGTRRALASRFPYAIVYREVADDEIEIVAVAHVKRRPRYWAKR